MQAWINRLKNHFTLVFAICATLLITFQFESTQHVYRFLTQDKLYDQNMDYLVGIEQSSVKTYLHLTELNATLSTMQSSIVGFSFFVETKLNIGEELKHFSQLSADGASYASKVTLTSIALQYLSAVSRDLTPILIKLLLALGCIYGLVGLYKNQSHLVMIFGFIRTVSVFFLLFHIVVPYTIHASDYISNQILHDPHLASAQKFSEIHQEIGRADQGKNVKDRAHSVMGKVEATLSNIDEKIEGMLVQGIDYLISMIFLTFVIPLLTGGFLLLLFKKIVFLYIIHPAELSLASSEAANG